MTTTTPEAPTEATPCAPWCEMPHDADEPCEAEPFHVPTMNSPDGARIGIRQGEDGPVLFIDAPWIPEPIEFNREQAVEFCQAVMELVCLLGACSCGHGPLCVRPDCPGDCGFTHEGAS